MNKQTLRILCISPLFPPRANAEAFCGAKLIIELLNRGVDVTVISLDSGSPQEEAHDDSDLWAPLKRITIAIRTPVHKTSLRSAIGALQFQTVTYARWIRAAVETAKFLHQKTQFDLIYSRSLPFAAHIAGYWISHILKIPWLANINDPWDVHLFPDGLKKDAPYLYRLISNYWMKKTLRTAALVTYPSSRLRDYHYRISGVKHKSEIIPHIGYVVEKGINKPEFRLVHAGKLGDQEGRLSTGLLQGLQLFVKKYPESRQSIRMTFVGSEDMRICSLSYQLGIQSIVETTGRVSYEKSLEYISSATVCILVEGKLSEGIFLPSKLADYIAARKPVLALSPKNGVVSDILSYRGIVRADVDDPQAIGDAIGFYFNASRQDSIKNLIPSEDLVHQFNPETIAKKIISDISIMMSSRG